MWVMFIILKQSGAANISCYLDVDSDILNEFPNKLACAFHISLGRQMSQSPGGLRSWGLAARKRSFPAGGGAESTRRLWTPGLSLCHLLPPHPPASCSSEQERRSGMVVITCTERVLRLTWKMPTLAH